MKKRLAIYMGSVLFLGAVSLMTLPAQDTAAAPKAGAAKKRERASPHEEVSAVLNGKKITISYGRPYKKGRVIFGGLEPLGKVWRTGADEATTITLEGDAMVGPLHVVAGTYSLFTIPNEKEWTLVLNKVAKQWGAFKYDQAMDYGRASMKVAVVKEPMEQLTISIDKKGEQAALKIAWDQTVATIDVQGH
ncbi:MAG: DUF2911 domain-containing protein [Acidobacteria bacterium]|nr:DUF2911 domain-containing protein [Acidobacteriota bacterium]